MVRSLRRGDGSEDGTRESLIRVAAPASAVIVCALIFEVAYGVSVGDALLYAAYEMCFVVIPGWAAYRALSRRAGGALRQLALGWALGYTLEVFAFMATAAIGARPLFYAYPAIVLVVAALVIRTRSGHHDAEDREESNEGEDYPLPRYFGWALAGACIVAIVYVGLSFFPTTPLPGTRSIAYFIDYPRWISLAADALHHWPITDPSVAGEPLPYHYFVNIHFAAAAQVTGIDLAVIYFRLFILPMVGLLVLLIALAGRVFSGSHVVGLIAVGLALLIGDLRLDPQNTFLAHTPFSGLFFTLLFRSPSFLFGLILFVPLVILIGDLIRERRESANLGTWLLVLLFMAGASDAKVIILPLVVAALVVYGGWRWIIVRKVDRAVWSAALLAASVAGFVWFVQYRGHAGGLPLQPFHAIDSMPAIQLIKGDLLAHVSDFPGRDAALDVGAVVLGILGLLIAPLIGIGWLVREWGWRIPHPQAWLFSVLLSGVVLGLVVVEPGTVNGLYFLFYGLVAGYLLSAHGLVLAWNRRPQISGPWTTFAVLGACFALFVVLLMAIPVSLDPFEGARDDALSYMFRYVMLAVAVVMLYLAGRRWLTPTRWSAAFLCSLAVVAVGALATPFDNLRPAIADLNGDSGSLGKQMSPELFRGLTWVRENTPTDAVVAVNNQWTDEANAVPLQFIYSAFTERRVFLEGWGYSQRTRALGLDTVENPFAERLELNLSAFATADRPALEALATTYGVRYLVVDTANGTPADLEGLNRFGRTVYADPGVVVIELTEFD